MDFNTLIKTFKVQDELHPDFWDESGNLDPEVRSSLLRTAKLFIESWDFNKKLKIYDIIFTGSLANYNYSKLSDVDLHVIINYEDLNEDKDLVEQLFSLLKSKFNDNHDIKMHGHEVEVYAEDKDNLHQSTGVYSLLDGNWIKVPEKTEPYYDEDDVKKKVSYFENLFKIIQNKAKKKDMDFVVRHVDVMKEKLRKMRRAGLLKGGEYSTENIAFKFLRRSGFFDKVNDFKNNVIDKSLSVEWQNEEFFV